MIYYAYLFVFVEVKHRSFGVVANVSSGRICVNYFAVAAIFETQIRAIF